MKASHIGSYAGLPSVLDTAFDAQFQSKAESNQPRPGVLRCRMIGHREMDDTPALMRQHQKHVEDVKPDRRDSKEVHRHYRLNMICKERPQVCEGGLRCRTIYLATLGSVISIPSFSNSP